MSVDESAGKDFGCIIATYHNNSWTATRVESIQQDRANALETLAIRNVGNSLRYTTRCPVSFRLRTFRDVADQEKITQQTIARGDIPFGDFESHLTPTFDRGRGSCRRCSRYRKWTRPQHSRPLRRRRRLLCSRATSNTAKRPCTNFKPSARRPPVRTIFSWPELLIPIPSVGAIQTPPRRTGPPGHSGYPRRVRDLDRGDDDHGTPPVDQGDLRDDSAGAVAGCAAPVAWRSPIKVTIQIPVVPSRYDRDTSRRDSGAAATF